MTDFGKLDVESIDPKQFWPALGSRAVGAAIVTACWEGKPAGFLALSVTHLTQDPPMVMVSIGSKTSALSAIKAAGHFAVSWLDRRDVDLSEDFAGRTAKKGEARFDACRWTVLATGAPVLRDCVGAIDCVLYESIERFETEIALGRVVGHLPGDGERHPLVYFKGRVMD